MRNVLLDALPRDVLLSLEPGLERVTLERGAVLHEPGATIRYLYFPLTCLVTITVITEEGKTAQTGVAGNREMIGVNAFMGGMETTQTRHVVQIPGDAMKLAAEPLLAAFNQNQDVRDVLLRYTQALIAQISQNAACSRLHDVRQRYARWLLEVRERTQSDELRLTQEFAAEMLGVRRATVTDMSKMFEEEELTRSQRGFTQVLDSAGLERAACGCYRTLRQEFDRLLGPRLNAMVATAPRRLT